MSYNHKYNTVVGPSDRQIEMGYGFTVSKRDSISSGNSMIITLENQIDSETKVHVKLIEFVAGASGEIDIYKNQTISGGTGLTPQNLNFESDNGSALTAKYNPTTSGGTKVIETVLPGGTGRKSIGADSDVGDKLFLPPGTSLTAVFTPDSNTKASIRILWIEEPL